ncbi:MAG: hypothetical protein ABSH05_15890 [Bryobacteraceae bacterium]|jgi:hypothetical protein
MRGYRRQAGGIVAGIVIAILVVVGTLTAGAILFLHNVRVEESVSPGGKTVRVETPVGSLRLRERARLNPRQLGLPVYPGATLAAKPGKAVDLELDFGGTFQRFDVLATEYSTADPAGKVIEFYRKNLPFATLRVHRDGSVEIKYSGHGCHCIVAIRDQGAGTRIALVQAGDGQVN